MLHRTRASPPRYHLDSLAMSDALQRKGGEPLLKLFAVIIVLILILILLHVYGIAMESRTICEMVTQGDLAALQRRYAQNPNDVVAYHDDAHQHNTALHCLCLNEWPSAALWDWLIGIHHTDLLAFNDNKETLVHLCSSVGRSAQLTHMATLPAEKLRTALSFVARDGTTPLHHWLASLICMGSHTSRASVGITSIYTLLAKVIDGSSDPVALIQATNWARWTKVTCTTGFLPERLASFPESTPMMWLMEIATHRSLFPENSRYLASILTLYIGNVLAAGPKYIGPPAPYPSSYMATLLERDTALRSDGENVDTAGIVLTMLGHLQLVDRSWLQHSGIWCCDCDSESCDQWESCQRTLTNPELYPLMRHIGVSPECASTDANPRIPLIIHRISEFGELARDFDNKWTVDNTHRRRIRVLRAGQLVQLTLTHEHWDAPLLADHSRVLCSALCDHDSQHMIITPKIVKDLADFASIVGYAPLLRLIWHTTAGSSPFVDKTRHGLLGSTDGLFFNDTQHIWVLPDIGFYKLYITVPANAPAVVVTVHTTPCHCTEECKVTNAITSRQQFANSGTIGLAIGPSYVTLCTTTLVSTEQRYLVRAETITVRLW